MLTEPLSLNFGENQEATRWKRDRHGSVANSLWVIFPWAVASSYARLRR
jgi:hypothetical protein